MTVRTDVIDLFRGRRKPLMVRDILNAGVQGRATISKECMYLANLGLLTAEREDNPGHGICYLFHPKAILLEPLQAPASMTTVYQIVRGARVPLLAEDVRAVINIICRETATKREVQTMLASLVENRELVTEGHSTRHALYMVASQHAAPWHMLGSVLGAWARGESR